MSRKRILVVDASETIVAVCQKMLAQQAYDSTVFQDGTRALEELKRSDYDLAVIATATQNVSGYFIVKELRKSRSKLKMPVLMLLGSSELLDTRELVDVAPDDTLSKPFSPQELLNKINDLLAKSESETDHPSDDLGIESILNDDANSFERKISSATDKIFLGILAQSAAEPADNRPKLDKLELTEDQYDLDAATPEVGNVAGPHDYDWFVSEMCSDTPTHSPELKPVKLTTPSGKFQIEEIGTSKIPLNQLKKMQSAGEDEKTKVYIEKLHKPLEDESGFAANQLGSAPNDLRSQFIKYFAEYLAKEVAKQIDFAKLADRIESEAVKLGNE